MRAAPAASTRGDVAQAAAAAAIVWTLALATLHPADGQEVATGSRPFESGSVAGAEPRLAHFLGSWTRNAQLSEDAVAKNEGMWRSPEYIPAVLKELASSLAARLGALEIRSVGDQLEVLDAIGGTGRFYLDGRPRVDPDGNESQLSRVGGTLKVEIFVSGWLAVHTFDRREDRLLRMTEFQHEGFPSLRVRTVYEHADGQPPPGPSVADGGHFYAGDVIRIVPPESGFRESVSGRVRIQTLAIDPIIAAVEFFLDGRRIRRVRKHPFTAQIELANPPREQTLEVRAYDLQGEYAGSDRIVLNRLDAPFAVRILELAGAGNLEAQAVRVQARVSVPRSARLERVDFYRSEDLVASVSDFGEDAAASGARTVPAGALIPDADPSDFVRVSARLADGRTFEDAALVQGAEYRSEIDVQLVQFQVLATDRRDSPVSGLSADDFEIRENGKRHPARDLHTAHDVPLVLGLAIDSSWSMQPIWLELKYVARRFLESALTPGDRAFLVDFDAMVRLLQPLDGDQAHLSSRLNRLIPSGGTALNNGLLFSLLQYRDEPGRRALVVITDGQDEHSRSRPAQASEFAERLGLPIYFIQLDPSGLMPDSPTPALIWAAQPRLRRISRRTGGRLFTVDLSPNTATWTAQLQAVFDQIEEDLRHQHVLTWYSDVAPGTVVVPEVHITKRGVKLRSAVPLAGIE